MIKFTKASKLNIVLLFVMLVLFALCFTTVDNCIAYAIDTNKFDDTYVMDDLNSSTVDGKAFNINDYPFDKTVSDSSAIKLINFVEYCYSYVQNGRGNFGLYLYLYNPKGLDIDVSNKSNKIQLAVSYNASGESIHYEKFDVKFCSNSAGDFQNLFYKFKVVDRQSTDGKKIVDRVNFLNRQYDVSGIELVTKGNQLATDYNIAGTYNFTGFSKGYGENLEAESTLKCRVVNLRTLALNLGHTSFRVPALSNLGQYHQNAVDSVYFSVPNEILSEYGNLQKINAEWWEYKTKMALMSNDQKIVDELTKYTGIDLGDKSYDDRYKLTVLGAPKSSPAIGSSKASLNAQWSFNFDLANIWTNNSTSFISNMLPYVFKVDIVNESSIFDFLHKNIKLGDVNSNVVSNYIYSYKNDLGHGNIEGREISKDLFLNTVDSGRKMGYNNPTIDFDDTFNLKSYDSENSWIEKLFTMGWKAPETGSGYENVRPIQEIKSNDLLGDINTVSKNMLINPNDVTSVQNACNTSKNKAETLFMFRFGNTDYYSMPATANIGYADTFYESSNCYLAQQSVFLNFDIIELTFNKDGVYRVIPAVSSPIDIINGYDAPLKDKGLPDWVKLLLLVLAVIAVVVLFTPFLPYIIQLVIYIIALPFKLIVAIVKACKRNKNKEVKVKDTKPIETKIKQKKYKEQQKPIKHKKQKKQNFRKQKR